MRAPDLPEDAISSGALPRLQAVKGFDNALLTQASSVRRNHLDNTPNHPSVPNLLSFAAWHSCCF